MKKAPSWHVVQRPKGMTSRYTAVVVDGSGLPHLPLTIFYHEIQHYLASGTARTYLNTLLPFFGYLASDTWRAHRQDRWESEPEAVRQAVRDYLVEQLHCKARHKNTYQLITLTAKSPSTVRVFLSSLKQFYHVARRLKWYPHAHPLIDPVNHLLQEIEIEEQRAAGQRPSMPQLSGVEDPKRQSPSDNYFKLVDDVWCPQSIDDPDLHVQLRQGFKLASYNLRDQIVVRMTYESGARIREILRLTIGDWRKRGAKQEAWTFSKGSHGRRVKVIRFSPETSRMLHSYVNTERAAFDSCHRRLNALDDAAPLFLSSRRSFSVSTQPLLIIFKYTSALFPTSCEVSIKRGNFQCLRLDYVSNCIEEMRSLKNNESGAKQNRMRSHPILPRFEVKLIFAGTNSSG
jgi:integrase